MIKEQLKELGRLWGGFQASRALITANNLGVFEGLKTSRSASELATALNLNERGLRLLLDALTGMGLLRKKKDAYKNAPVAIRFLLRGTPYYQGDILRHMDSLWRSWSELDEVVRTGQPARGGGRNLDAFIMGMHNIASVKAKKAVRAIGLRGVRTALDLGGGPGTYALEMAKKGIAVTLFDIPGAIEIAKGIASEKKAKGIAFKGGDFLVDDIGKAYDLIFISQILHAYSETDCIGLLRKCKGAAASPGGRVVIQERKINEERTLPARSALFSINMLVNTSGGRCYSPKEMKGWLLRAGFSKIKVKPLDDSVLVEGRA